MIRMQRRMFCLALVLAFAPLVFGACSANGWFYRPDKRVYATPEATGLVIEEGGREDQQS